MSSSRRAGRWSCRDRRRRREMAASRSKWRRLAERLGYDSIWVYDHFHNVPRPAHEAVFECWTTMAAISQLTSTIRLGQMVGCNSYRNPARAGQDHVEHRRDLRWPARLGDRRRLVRERVPRHTGSTSRRPKDRIGMLDETVQIVKSMWTEPETTFAGKYYEVKRANCDPKPLQQPAPPIWIGGGGEQLTLRVVAKYADCSNFGGPPETWAHKRDVLRRHCAAVGRDPDEIRMTWSPEVFIRRTEAEVDAAGSLAVWGQPADEWRANNLVGTVEQVTEKMQDLRRPRLPRLRAVVLATTPTPSRSNCSPPRSCRSSADGRARSRRTSSSSPAPTN